MRYSFDGDGGGDDDGCGCGVIRYSLDCGN